MIYTNLSMLEFNLLNNCNRSCSFCPVDNSKQPAQLPLYLFEKVILELKEIDYAGRISFSGFSEPLLHTDLIVMIKKINLELPKASLTICTNGDLLNEELMLSLFKLGLYKLNISKYENYNKFIDTIDNPKVEIKDRTGTDWINNRAGAIKTDIPVPQSICYYPFYSLYIDYNGDVQFCCHDYDKQVILGNIEDDELFDISQYEGQLNTTQNMLHRGERSMTPCINCNVDGTKEGKEAYEKWKKNRIYQISNKS